jgi:hypothetical protein
MGRLTPHPNRRQASPSQKPFKVSQPDIVVDPDKLAAALADRLAAIAPDGIHVQAADGMLWYSCVGRFPAEPSSYRPGSPGTYVRDNFEAHAEDMTGADSATAVGSRAPGELQDFVDEATREPWPGTTTPPHPFVEVRSEMLHLWYGDKNFSDDPVFACEPIPLASLRP